MNIKFKVKLRKKKLKKTINMRAIKKKARKIIKKKLKQN